MCREDQNKRPRGAFFFLTSKNASLGQAAIQADGSTMAIFAVTMVKASIGQGGQAAVMPQCLSRLRLGEEGEDEEGVEEEGFMVDRMRARQSATALLDAQARAGV